MRNCINFAISFSAMMLTVLIAARVACRLAHIAMYFDFDAAVVVGIECAGHAAL